MPDADSRPHRMVGRPIDRAISIADAVQMARAEFDRIRLEPSIVWHGRARVPECVASRAGRFVTRGWGKGEDERAEAGALFEALERYYMTDLESRRRAPENIMLMSAYDVASQPELQPDLVIQRWAQEFPSEVAACIPYYGPSGRVHYPTFLLDPKYHLDPQLGDTVARYPSLLRYTSSLGTAAGATFTEAVLHGLCELIEHDGLSSALLRWHFTNEPDAFVVPGADLPAALRRRFDEVCELVGSKVDVVDVTSDLGIPTFLAVSEFPPRAVLFGSGASHSATVAVDRALSELQQGWVIEEVTGGATAYSELEPWPFLQRCLVLHRAGSVIRRQVMLRPSLGDEREPESALIAVTNALKAHSIEYFAAELTPADAIIKVATLIAPGLDKFSLVHLGTPVLPTGRGWRIWKSASGG